jgi:hypothetical protein
MSQIPTSTSANAEVCCRCGKLVYGKEAIPSPDPYQAEINDDDTPVVECNDCRENSLDDI